MKYLLRIKKIFFIHLCFLSIFLVNEVDAHCFWDNDRIEFSDVDSRNLAEEREADGKDPDIPYRLEYFLADLPKIKLTEGGSAGPTILEELSRDGEISFGNYQKGFLQISTSSRNFFDPGALPDGLYKAYIPNVKVMDVAPLIGDYGNDPCGPVITTSRDLKVGNISGGEIASTDITKDKQEILMSVRTPAPSRQLINLRYKIVSADSTHYGENYEISGNGVDKINISSLHPIIDDSGNPTQGEETYKIIIMFDCDNGGICTFPGWEDLTFKKTVATIPVSNFELENRSNNSVNACHGDIDCINCVIRKPDGSRFGDESEASNAVGNTREFIYTNNVYTAIGCVDTTQNGVIVRIIQIGIGIAGGLIIIRVGQAILLIQGADNPDKKKEGVEMITSAFVALLVIIFAAMGLKFLGVNVFRIFSPGTIETTNE